MLRSTRHERRISVVNIDKRRLRLVQVTKMTWTNCYVVFYSIWKRRSMYTLTRSTATDN